MEGSEEEVIENIFDQEVAGEEVIENMFDQEVEGAETNSLW